MVSIRTADVAVPIHVSAGKRKSSEKSETQTQTNQAFSECKPPGLNIDRLRETAVISRNRGQTRSDTLRGKKKKKEFSVYTWLHKRWGPAWRCYNLSVFSCGRLSMEKHIKLRQCVQVISLVFSRYVLLGSSGWSVYSFYVTGGCVRTKNNLHNLM